MRGALQHNVKTGDIGGIIPADAGSTIREAPAGGGHPDHPRECGEHSSKRVKPLVRSGSSLRMRGAPRGCSPLISRPRIIPSDAGST